MTDPAFADGRRAPPGPTPRSATRTTALALSFELGLLAAAVAAAALIGRRTLTSVSPSGSGLVIGSVATLPLLVLLQTLRRSAWPPVVRLRREVDDHLLPLFRGCTLWQIAAMAAAAGLGEEALFRGLLQGLISEVAGITIGVVGASVLFGLAHMITPTYAILAGGVGVYLGWLAIASGGIWAPTVTHAAYDFIALALWVRGQDAGKLGVGGPSENLTQDDDHG